MYGKRLPPAAIAAIAIGGAISLGLLLFVFFFANSGTEVKGYVEMIDADGQGRTVIWVAARPPTPPGTWFASGDDLYRSFATAALTPLVRCVFDRSPGPLLEGRLVRVRGVPPPWKGKADTLPPDELLHCRLAWR
jgi:hypothetical protein